MKIFVISRDLMGSNSSRMTGNSILRYAMGENPKPHMTSSCTSWMHVNWWILRCGTHRM